MFLGANNLIFGNAKRLRDSLTHTELILWGYLSGGQLGVKFRRQHPINDYIADFYCHAHKLVIEIDGSIHLEPDVLANDIERQQYLEGIGLKVIRFTNREVFKSLEKVLATINQYINPADNGQD
jgi:cyclase